MDSYQIYFDLRALIELVLTEHALTDNSYQYAQELAKRYGMVELLADRQGLYEGGDG